MSAGCRKSFFFLALLVGFAPTGCRHNTGQELLENELRARDMQYREVLDELKRSEFHKDVLQRELDSARNGNPVPPEVAAHTFGVRRLALGRGTGGVDADHLPGDEAIQVVVEPRDGDDHVIKAPGTLEISVLEISTQGVKSNLATWELTQEQMRQSWKQGLFSTGYVFVLPWKSWPQSENLRVVARLYLSDKRVFEADRDIKVRVPTGLPPRHHEVAPPPREFREEKIESNRPDLKTPVQQATWQPAPLQNAVKLLRPEPIDPRPPVHFHDIWESPREYSIWP